MSANFPRSNDPASEQFISSRFAAARNCVQRADLDGAETACREIVDKSPDHFGALQMLGAIAAHNGNVQEATSWLERATAVNPRDSATQVELGRLLLQQPDRIDDAIAALRTAADAHPSAAIFSDLGHGLLSQGKLDEAETVLRKAIALDPNFAIAHCNLGAIFRARNRSADAARAYALAARLQPAMFEAHFYEGLAHAEAKDIALADVAFERAVRTRPGPATLHQIASALIALGFAPDAVKYFNRAHDAEPSNIEYLISLAAALIDANRPLRAETFARKAIALAPADARAHLNLASALHLQDAYDAAVAEYETSLRLDPANAQAKAQLGGVLSQLGRDDEAIALCRAALAQAPHAPMAQGYLVQALVSAMQMDEAIALAKKFVTESPANPDLRVSYGAALYETGDTDGASSQFHQAMQVDPNHRDAHINLSLALLATGKLRDGWREYSYRTKPEVDPRFKSWDGSMLFGQPIVLRTEQGFGDNIQFIRYAPLIAKRGGRVVVLTTARSAIHRLLQTAPGVDYVTTLPEDPRCAAAKVAALMLDLPAIFETTLDSIPAGVPYLSVPPAANVERRKKLEDTIDRAQSKLRVGLVWAGNVAYGNNRKRSIPIEALAPIIGMRNMTFFSLQVNPVAQRDAKAIQEMGIIDLDECLSDFGDTAAALMKLDLLISVDTGVAHLAGALARPVWTLLPRICDWRWLRDREDTAWYPTMRLFRQPKLGDWTSAIANVATALRAQIAGE